MAAGAVLCSVHEHPHLQDAGGHVGGGEKQDDSRQNEN